MRRFWICLVGLSWFVAAGSVMWNSGPLALLSLALALLALVVAAASP